MQGRIAGTRQEFSNASHLLRLSSPNVSSNVGEKSQFQPPPPSMAPIRKRSRVAQARQYLTGGAVFREDSDDELGYEDHPWEWIYEDSDAAQPAQNATPRKRRATASSEARRIVAARMGSFTCTLGDCVLLKAEGSHAWVGIICDFFEDEEDDEKMAKFLWFSSEREIRNKSTKRTDHLPVRFNSLPSRCSY